jgi:aspartate/methionine/tyrosine aminotransferase
MTLSRRGRQLIDSPPLAEYILEHFGRADRTWHATDRPDGYVPLCIAENMRRAPDLLARLNAYAADVPPSVLGYDAMIGNLQFRENLAAFLGRTLLGRRCAAEHLAVLAGAGTVLEQLFWAIADEGEGVLVPTPSYAGFWADLETRDALKIVRVDTRYEDDFLATPDDFEAALQGADVPIRALLLTSPDNPLGRVHGADHLDAILQWAQSHRIHVVFDEVYGLSTFGTKPFVSGASLRPTLGERTHVVWAFSKDFGASGLRCGALVSENSDVVHAVDQLAYWSACSGHSQHLLSRFVADTPAVDAYLHEVRCDLADAYRRVTVALDGAEIPYLPAEAGFFLVCDLRRHLDAPTRDGESRLWRQLLDEAGVNLTPGGACRIAEPGFFRLCYASVDLAGVEIGIDRMRRCLRGR